MFGIESLGGWTQAGVIIGVVLLEAIVLYAGYGGLEQLVGSKITNTIRGE